MDKVTEEKIMNTIGFIVNPLTLFCLFHLAALVACIINHLK